jgi:hypothetical protein
MVMKQDMEVALSVYLTQLRTFKCKIRRKLRAFFHFKQKGTKLETLQVLICIVQKLLNTIF